MAANSNEEAKAWCLAARELLARKRIGKSDRSKLGDDIADVDKLLKQCVAKGFQNEPRFIELQNLYRTLAGEAKAAQEDAKTSADDKQKAIKAVAARIATLVSNLKDFEAAQVLKAGYAAQLLAAQKVEQEVKLLNWDVFTYDPPVTALIERAATMAKSLQYTEAAALLKSDIPKLKSTQVSLQQADKNAETSYLSLLSATEANVRKLKLLTRGALSYEAPLQALVDKARLARTNGKVIEAEAELKKEAAKLYTAQAKAAATQQGDEIDTARFKPVFLDKVARINAAIKELTPLPGTNAAVVKLQGLIDAGRKEAADSEDYEKAYKKLSGLSGTLKDGRQAAADFPKKAGDSAFRTLLAGTRAHLETYTALVGLSQPDEVKRFNDELRQILLDLDKSQDEKKKTQTAAAAIDKIDKELVKRNGSGELLKAECEKLALAARQQIADIRRATPPSFASEFEMQHQLAQTAFGLQDYATAKQKFGELTAARTKAFELYGADFNEWLTTDKLVKEQYLETMRAISKADVKVQPMRKRVSELLRDYASAEELVATERNYKEALAAAKAVVAEMPAFKNDFAAMQKLVPARDKAYEALAAPNKACMDKILQMEARWVFSDGREIAGKTWKDFRDAVDAAATEKDIKDAETVAKNALVKLGRDLDAFLKDTKLMAESETKGKATHVRPRLDAEAAKFAAEAKPLLSRHASELAPLQLKFKTVMDLAASEETAGRKVTEAHIADAAKVVAELVLFKTTLKQKTDTSRDEVRRMAKDAVARVAKLRKAHGKFKAYFDDLEAEVLDAEAMASSQIGAVVDAARELLLPAGRVMKKVVAAETSADFDKVAKEMVRLAKLIDDDTTLSTCAPTKQKTLRLRLTEEVALECYKTTPAAALVVLATFAQDIAEVVLAATGDLGRRQEIVQKKKDAVALLANLDEGALKQSMIARIDAAAVPTEGREHDSIVKLNALKVMLQNLATDPDLLLRMGQQVEQKAFEEKKATGEWLARIDVFEKNQLREVKAAYDNTPSKARDEGRKKAIDTTLASAKKLAAQGQHLQAVMRLEDAIKMSVEFLASPMNDKTTARDSLGKVARKWKQVVAKFVADANAVADAIRNSRSEIDPVADAGFDATVLDRTVSGIKAMTVTFNPLQFDASIEGMDQHETRDAAYLKFKEDALTWVRSYQKQLDTDPLLKHIETYNPFKPLSSKALRDALVDLELNFKRA